MLNITGTGQEGLIMAKGFITPIEIRNEIIAKIRDEGLTVSQVAQ